MDIFKTGYPRPQFVRRGWESLNGTWTFAFDDENIGEDAKIFAFTMAEKARAEGLRAQSDLMARSLKAQMKYADKIGAKYTVVLGDEEIANKTAVAKNMATKEQVTLDLTKPIREQL